MFAKVSDKFHRRQASSSKPNPTSPVNSPTSLSKSPPRSQPAPRSPQQTKTVPASPSPAPNQAKVASSPPPATPQSQPEATQATPSAPVPMDGIESASANNASSPPAAQQVNDVSNATPNAGAVANNTAQPEVNRTMSIEMADVSNLSIQTPPGGDGRQGSADEDRMRSKAREAQEQAAQAQQNLHNATQQARVAAINAAATQAALDTTTGSTTPTRDQGAPRKTAGRYAFADFHVERTLGTGSFGRVHLVKSKHNSRFYAIKVLNKEKVVKMKQVEHTNSEREMLVRVRHPFLVNLWGTFQDANNLYMVMDFVAGGELFSLLRKSQRFPNSVAKFYAAEVALALDYLHSLDIIYRDLKPENILLGADGHVKVTDFGFAKHVPDITWTLCGTPDYLAPEVVQSKGYNKSVDWYALGVLIFEMLAGYPPFFTEDGNPMKLYEKIIAGKVRYPTYFDNQARELLKNLLIGDLTKRYGNLRAGSADIFGHGWFSEVDWDKLYRREIPAPYVPKIDGEGDSSQFDRYAEADVSSYGKQGTNPHDHLFPDF